jgi:uncharacterized protein (DUF433 family)
MTTHERIEMNPEVMGGKPVIRGTRVPVEIVLRKQGGQTTSWRLPLLPCRHFPS